MFRDRAAFGKHAGAPGPQTPVWPGGTVRACGGSRAHGTQLAGRGHRPYAEEELEPGARMIAVILRFLLVVLKEMLRVAGASVLKAMAAAALAALISGLAQGLKAGIAKAKEETSASREASEPA